MNCDYDEVNYDDRSRSFFDQALEHDVSLSLGVPKGTVQVLCHQKGSVVAEIVLMGVGGEVSEPVSDYVMPSEIEAKLMTPERLARQLVDSVSTADSNFRLSPMGQFATKAQIHGPIAKPILAAVKKSTTDELERMHQKVFSLQEAHGAVQSDLASAALTVQSVQSEKEAMHHVMQEMSVNSEQIAGKLLDIEGQVRSLEKDSNTLLQRGISSERDLLRSKDSVTELWEKIQDLQTKNHEIQEEKLKAEQIFRKNEVKAANQLREFERMQDMLNAELNGVEGGFQAVYNSVYRMETSVAGGVKELEETLHALGYELDGLKQKAEVLALKLAASQALARELKEENKLLQAQAGSYTDRCDQIAQRSLSTMEKLSEKLVANQIEIADIRQLRDSEAAREAGAKQLDDTESKMDMLVNVNIAKFKQAATETANGARDRADKQQRVQQLLLETRSNELPHLCLVLVGIISELQQISDQQCRYEKRIQRALLIESGAGAVVSRRGGKDVISLLQKLRSDLDVSMLAQSEQRSLNRSREMELEELRQQSGHLCEQLQTLHGSAGISPFTLRSSGSASTPRAK
jgi:hypothetical protein